MTNTNCVCVFSFMQLVGFAFAARVHAEPELWWADEWDHRQAVKMPGGYGRIPWNESASRGRFVTQPEGRELRHWTQTIEATKPRMIATDPKVHYGFPRMIRAADGRLLMYYRVGRSHASDPATIAQRTSRDDGVTWSEERSIHRDPDGFSAHNPVAGVAKDGRVVLFVSSYDWKTPAKLPMYWSHSDDHGETWAPFEKFDTDPSRSTYYMTDVLSTEDGLYGMSAGFAPDHMTQAHNLLWFSQNGREWELRSFHTQPEANRGDEVDIFQTASAALTVLHRDRRHTTTWRYRSKDSGRTWSEAEDIGDQVEILQRPFVTRLSPQVLLLSGRDRKRRLVVVYVSRDNGGTFVERHVIDSYSADGAYTAAVRLSDRKALLVYYGDTPTTRGKPDIKQVTLTLQEQPKYICFEAAKEGATYLYTRAGRSDQRTEDRSGSWMQPPGGWQVAELAREITPRGTIPLAPPPVWKGEYSGIARPERPWRITKNGSTRIAVDESSSALRILDEGKFGNEMAYVSREWELRPGRTVEIDVSLKVLSCSAPGGCMLRVADGVHEEAFTFFPDRIYTNRSGLTHKMDLASGFVDLRISLDGDSFAVRSGNSLLIDGKGLLKAPAYQGRRTLDFGCGSSSGTGEALWRSLRYQISGRQSNSKH